MRLTSAVKRPWLAVPLLLSIASVMALSNASLACDDNDSFICPSLASVDTRSVIRVPSLERPGGLDLLGPLAEALDDDSPVSRTTSSTRTSTPTPKPKSKPEPKPKPKKTSAKPKPKHKTKSTSSSKHKSKTTSTKPHATSHRPPNNTTPNPNPTKTHTTTTTARVIVPTTTAARTESSPPASRLTPTVTPEPIEQTTAPGEPTSADSVTPSPPTPTGGEPTPVVTPQDSSIGAVTPTPTPAEPSAPAATPTDTAEEPFTAPRPNRPPRETVSNSFDEPTPSPKIEPTPAATTTLDVNSTTTMTFIFPSTTTMPVPRTTTTTASNTTTTTALPVTISPTATATSHHTHPTTTTTPWLPSTIEPLAPPKVTSTARPGTSLPDIVIPNLNPDIPANSFNVVLRLEHVSYYQVINNGILAAQLVSFLPAQLGRVLKVDTSLIQVLAIRDGSDEPMAANGATVPPVAVHSTTTSASTAATTTTATKSKRTVRKRGLVTSPNSSDAILVTVSIPRNKYWPLNSLVVDQSSALYVKEVQSFGQFLDHEYALASHPPSLSRGGGGSDGSDGQGDGDDGDATADPLTGDNPSQIPGPDGNTNGGSSKSSSAPIIGSVVALATIAYVGIAIVVVRRVQAKKLREQQERDAIRQNISGPINVQGGANGWGWHRE
ncbi:hypothetical protein EC957_003773 [Mortierella hygrophila]|uniref:Uncharacterized protein n=1 Tax=Mortierella hygrophila TaxID=979708 RepID=A0A9P6F2D0_9FUNG|nr:hypothetical protein EC957_003773 [Mortierella hygrophila]